ncbi:hypothetical protein BDY24DRAFT_377078 [Mrakia frigida]|uniref:uncharacterized protein n=1 Tax=Mrakia frigida TaxID=29902 RepID=UPI003FCC0201
MEFRTGWEEEEGKDCSVASFSFSVCFASLVLSFFCFDSLSPLIYLRLRTLRLPSYLSPHTVAHLIRSLAFSHTLSQQNTLPLLTFARLPTPLKPCLSFPISLSLSSFFPSPFSPSLAAVSLSVRPHLAFLSLCVRVVKNKEELNQSLEIVGTESG